MKKKPKRIPKPKATTPPDPFSEFIANKVILIADSTSSVRTNIAKLLKSMGAETKNMVFAMNLSSALTALEDRRPQIVITDYFLGSDCGLRLIEPHRTQWTHERDRESTLFVVITANAEQSAIVQAAEEEVDAYVLKPFSIKSFRDHFTRAFMNKREPSPYMLELQKARLCIQREEWMAALEKLEVAIALSKTPSMAHFYVGLAYDKMGSLEKAEAAYRKGLDILPKHLRCTMGLMENLYHQERYPQALHFARQILKLYTLSPSKLELVIHLAIKNQAFEEISTLYEIYRGVEFRSKRLIQSMVAALVVTGKHYLQIKKSKQADKFFLHAISLSHRSTQVVRNIVLAWIENCDFEKANLALQQYPTQHRNDPDFEILNFLVYNGTAKAVDALNTGIILMRSGVKSPEIYLTLIRRMIETKRYRAAESMAFEAASTFEDHREKFLKLIST